MDGSTALISKRHTSLVDTSTYLPGSFLFFPRCYLQ
nr:MAG TPA: hypothetical protein [Bacteriophage sp.]